MQQQQANQIIQQGLMALQQNRPADAKAAFETLIRQGTVNASIWLAMALACRALGDRDGMKQAAQQSIAMEPRNPRAYIVQADQLADDGDHRSASAYYRMALKVAPPLEQAPADLKPELVRANESYERLTREFETYLDSKLSGPLAEAGDEARRVQASIDIMTGRNQPYTQQPKNYYFPGLPDIPFYDNAGFDWIAGLEAAFDDVLSELNGVIADQAGEFSPYVTGNDRRPQSDPHGMQNNDSWSAFYLWKDGEKQEENAARCPKTVAAFEKVPFTRVPGRSPSILFSKLKPGATIPPHNGLVNTRLIGHLPLIIPEGCGFRVGNEVREWEPGKVWLFDDTIEHEAWNKSSETRYILIFEVWKPELSDTERALVSDIFKAVDGYS